MTDIVYSYKPKPWIMLLAGGFFALCFIPILDTAQHNDRGLIINHIITLETEQATWFFWFLTVACVVFVLAGVFGFVKGLTSTATLRLTDSDIRVPKGFFKSRDVTIAYKDIRDLTTQEINGQQFLNIHHSKGKISITRSMMESKDKFASLIKTLTERLNPDQGA